MPMKAFCYVRVSTADQIYSPEAQEKQARTYCAARGCEVVGVISDIATSGSVEFSKRAGGGDVLARIGEVDAIVFAKLDRAFRDTTDCLLTVDRLIKLGKTVHFIDLGIDTSTPAGKLCLTVFAGLAEFERQRIRERIRDALEVAKSRGVKIGPAPYGYENVVEFNPAGERTSRGRHRKIEAEYSVVEQVVAMRDGGATYRAIADELNAWGAPTRLGGRWTVTHIARMVERERAS